MILTPWHSTTSPGRAPSTLPPLLDGEVDDDAARPHQGDLRVGDRRRRRPARNQRSGDDDVLLGDMARDEARPALSCIRRTFRWRSRRRPRPPMPATVSTKIGLAPRLAVVFPGRRAHVGRRDHGAQAAGGGDRLQAGDSDTHHEQARGRDRCRRRSSSSGRRGHIRPPRRAPPCSRRRLAWLDRMSIDWARVMRGANSIASASIPADAPRIDLGAPAERIERADQHAGLTPLRLASGPCTTRIASASFRTSSAARRWPRR